MSRHEAQYAAGPQNVTGIPLWARWALGVALGLGIAALVRRGTTPGAAPRERIERPSAFYLSGDFAEMVPPIRSPTSEDGKARIEVFLRIPPGAVIATVDGPDGATLKFPVGTRADRVESFTDAAPDAPHGPSFHVADVRSTTIEADGETFRVLRPTRLGLDASLLGIQWRRGVETEARAQDAIGALVLNREVFAPADAAARAEAAKALQSINGCSGCHVANKREHGQGALVRRATDASGFFQPQTVLSDRALVETYRPRNPNLTDPSVVFVCGQSPAIVDPSAPGGLRCGGGGPVAGVVDVVEARRRGDQRVERLCASRRYLYARLDLRGRQLFRPSIEVCDRHLRANGGADGNIGEGATY